MNALFESERLAFRQFTLQDALLIFELNSDPDVVKYLHEPVVSIEKASDVLINIILPQYTLYNHGRWAVYLKATQQFIGWCGLKYRPETNDVDLGYRFMKKYWDNGYATEAALQTIVYAFSSLPLQQLVAAADIDNIASQRVIEKAGFTYVGNNVIDECHVKSYVLIKPTP